MCGSRDGFKINSKSASFKRPETPPPAPPRTPRQEAQILEVFERLGKLNIKDDKPHDRFA